jgi:prefoldin subunit 5
MRMNLYLAATLFTPALVAQAPAPEVSLTQRLRTERPEVERLIADLKARDALKRAETLLPAAKPVFDKKDLQTQVASFAKFMDLSQAYYVAFKAADAAGYWEKALEYIKQAQALSGENYAAVKEPFTQAAQAYKNLAQNTRNAIQHTKSMLKDNQTYIQSLREKKDKDDGDKQQLELVAKEEKNLPESEKKVLEAEKWSQQFTTFLNIAKEESERYQPFAESEDKRIKDQEAQIADYKAGKGSKDKWVEAIAANPHTMDALTEKRDRIAFLYRLNALDPDNKKVQKQIDVVLGKAVAAPEKKNGKGKKK